MPGKADRSGRPGSIIQARPRLPFYPVFDGLQFLTLEKRVVRKREIELPCILLNRFLACIYQHRQG